MVSVLYAIVLVLVVIIAGIAWFFRWPAPPRLLAPPDYVLAPCWGEVRRIHDRTIVVFLSPLDIHRQYYPVGGRIVSRQHDCTGQFYLAYDLDKSSLNEKITTVVEHRGALFTIRQIAGWFARCISATGEVGDTVERASPMGMIEFGSRVDIVLPVGYRICVDVGSRVHGYDTILAVPD